MRVQWTRSCWIKSSLGPGPIQTLPTLWRAWLVHSKMGKNLIFGTEEWLHWDATSARGMISWITRVDGAGAGLERWRLREGKGNPKEHCECGLPLLICCVLCEGLYLFPQIASEGVWGQCSSCISPKEAFLSDTCWGRTEERAIGEVHASWWVVEGNLRLFRELWEETQNRWFCRRAWINFYSWGASCLIY